MSAREAVKWLANNGNGNEERDGGSRNLGDLKVRRERERVAAMLQGDGG